MKLWYTGFEGIMPYKDPDERKRYHRQYHKKYYQAHKQRFKTDSVNRRKRIKEAIYAFKIAKGCRICGYNRCASALGFHHRDGDKKFSISRAVARGWGEARIYDEIAKCDVLCANCHHECHFCGADT